ncbi:CENP-A-nucleosome distal centromere subunit CENP-L [Penicillium riverlandense]|uniref:CENP-A-nucleosome distal centromere subunit CENP-L n=1 Tax=Penicillium riverlandense TaxID=1903569 RepID=UPI002547B4FA|nr:CENP-A-nucleosome distal centromere subunit CENP-L [Penicillium riverlandense]KAJ5818136.1 CENP-A-nucleosome distal centromere subunit CENP-L [Penicillium riverlandense]
MEQGDPRQLLNTSWTLHRLSPLHHGKDCETLLDDPAALKTYATRLRDYLTGDVLAGIHASATTADDDALSKTGALMGCHWQSLSGWGALNNDDSTSFPGILVTLEYENVTYKAALLAEAETSPQSSQQKGSTALPLLLTRFPTALRQTFIVFLSSNFDTYCSPLRLQSSFLCTSLETYIDVLHDGSATRPSGSTDLVEDVIKELQLTLSFSPLVAPALRTLNVNVSRSSLEGFLHEQPTASRGRSLRQKLRSPLIGNLTSYLETHLAMNVDLDGSRTGNQPSKQHVRLSKVACAAFVLGSEGRMKLVVNTEREDEDAEASSGRRDHLALRASLTLLESVIRRAVIGDHAAT